MEKILLIRADANVQIGTGHIMRCLALAQAWQEAGGKAHFALASATPVLEARLTSEGMNLTRLNAPPGSAEDATQTIALARKLAAVWVVVDGYHFGADYQQAIKAAGLRLLFIDDYGHADHYCADIVLNQNIYADESLYARRAPGVELLLGTRYALLRREFWPWCGWKREIPPVARKVLVTMGGADPNNVTLKVIQALQQTDIAELQARVVVGGGNPHLRELEYAIRNTQHAIRLIHNASNMPELMAWADVAISAGGSTCWELAFMGLPILVVILAENQCLIAQELATAKIAHKLGWHTQITADQIAHSLQTLTQADLVSMSERGQQLVDGRGSNRVVEQVMAQREATVCALSI